MIKQSLQFITVDVSELAPPEPMTVILKQLSVLTVQQCLLVKHRKQPFPLYEKLADAGFSYYCVVHTQDAITLYIYHQIAEPLFNQLLAQNCLEKDDY
ncbi:DUF2249 domain-containing protein [Colwellia sp. E150_009]